MIFTVCICMVLKLPTGSIRTWGLIAWAVGDMTRVQVLSFEYLAREIHFTDFAILRAHSKIAQSDIDSIRIRCAADFMKLSDDESQQYRFWLILTIKERQNCDPVKVWL